MDEDYSTPLFERVLCALLSNPTYVDVNDAIATAELVCERVCSTNMIQLSSRLFADDRISTIILPNNHAVKKELCALDEEFDYVIYSPYQGSSDKRHYPIEACKVYNPRYYC